MNLLPLIFSLLNNKCMSEALPWYRFNDKRPQHKERIKIKLEDQFTEIIKEVVYESEPNEIHLKVSANGTFFHVVFHVGGFTEWQRIEQIFEPKFFWEK